MCLPKETKQQHKKQNKTEEKTMAVLSKPVRPLFSVDPKKTQAFFESSKKHTAQMALDRAAKHREAAKKAAAKKEQDK